MKGLRAPRLALNRQPLDRGIEAIRCVCRSSGRHRGEAEFEAVRALYAEGSIRQIWLRADTPGACAIVEASSDVEAAKKVNALPLIHAGILQPPTIVPLTPYAGFAPRSTSTT